MNLISEKTDNEVKALIILAGRKAKLSGLSNSHNPYQHNSIAWQWWEHGHDEVSDKDNK